MKRGKKSTVFIVLAMVAACVYVACFGLWIQGIGWKRVDRIRGAYSLNLEQPDMRLGIDIRGGIEAVFEPSVEARSRVSGSKNGHRA